MNRKFAIIISVATVLLVVLLIALSIFRSSSQKTEQATVAEVVIPTTSPNNQTFSNSSSSIKSNDEIQLNSSDTSAVESTVKKLPIDTDLLKVEYSDLLDTFYIQNNATEEAQLNQFLEENNLLNLYKSQPKFFKFTQQNPKDVKDEDEFGYVNENGIGETNPEDSPTNLTGNEKQLYIMKKFSSILFGSSQRSTESSDQTNNTPVISPPSTQPPSELGKNPNCANVVGNEKIVCSALKYTGIRYGYSSSARGNEQSKKRWGVISKGQNGHNPATWIAQRIPGGDNDFLECSGYTAVAIYDAFGVVADHCSVNYYGAKNFKKIDINTARAGDLLIKGTGCATSGGGGHIGIFVSRNSNGRIKTLESTPRGNGRSGPYEVSPTFFDKAVRYTGPGSTP